MIIRQATLEDSKKLQELQAQCPQGTSLIVSTVNTPDFFARAKSYELYRVFVVCDHSLIIGSGACAFRNGLIDGQRETLGYEFQFFISPDYRRKGVAKQLRRHIEEFPIEQGAAISYALIMEDNIPSMRLMESDGFTMHRRLIMRTLPILKEKPVKSGGKIRTAQDDDLPAVSELINATWRDHEMFLPTTAVSLKHAISRIHAFSSDDIYLLEDRNGISACLGSWDWSQVMRVTVEKLSRKIQWMGRLLVMTGIMHRFIKPGDIMKQIMLTFMGCKDPSDLSVLLRHLNNQMLGKGIKQIFCIGERGGLMLESTMGFTHVDTTMQLYVKPLKRSIRLGSQSVFIDGIDV